MNRYILNVAVIPVSVFIFKMFSLKDVLRQEYYTDFYEYVLRLEREVNFTLGSLNEITNSFSSGKFIDAVKSPEKIKGYKFLTDDDKRLFISFIESIGNTDRLTQTKLIEKIKSEISVKLNESVKNGEKNKKMYFKLGILSGLFIFILLL